MIAAIAVVVLLSVSAAAAASNTPPIISDDFTAKISVVEFLGSNRSPQTNSIMMFSDSQNNRFLSVSDEAVSGSNSAVPVYDLHLYQTGANHVYSSARSKCNSNTEVNATFPAMFKWLRDATFEGQTMVHSQLVDVWVLNLNDGEMVLSLFAAGNIPVRVSQFVNAADGHSTTVILEFNEFVAAVPDSSTFAVPAYCSVPKAPLFSGARTRIAYRVHAAMEGNVGIHWECDICKIAAETIISMGCGAGSAVCGPFAEVCEEMCEEGCMVASCTDRVCKKFGFC